MPTPATPGANRYVCEAFGRHFNTEGGLKDHARECVAARQSGSGNTRAAGAQQREEGDDREWVSTP